jgi:hypothetical protein
MTVTVTPAQARELILAGTAPKNMSVSGGLNLAGCTGLAALPEGLSVGGGLDLAGCTGLAALPEGLSVGGGLDLTGCTGLADVAWFAKPAGNHSRLGPVCRVNGGTRVSLGCWLDTPARTYAAIGEKYGPDSEYESVVREAVERFEGTRP